MNVWLAAAAALMLGLVPCGIVIVRGRPLDQLVGLELATALLILILLCIAKGIERESSFDVALMLAVLSFPAGLVFARFYERWL